jgi:hypothetical protein
VKSKTYEYFEDWYEEIEGFSLRAERMVSPVEELRAAFEAGKAFKTSINKEDVCHKCSSISGVYFNICDDCITTFNILSKNG